MELVEYSNVAQLADQIQRVLDNPASYRKMAENANRISYLFSWTNVINMMNETINNKRI